MIFVFGYAAFTASARSVEGEEEMGRGAQA